MRRRILPMLGLVLAAACRGDTPSERDQPPEGARTGSAYTTGSESGAVQQQVEGTNTGVEFEAPRRIPGVLAVLEQIKRQPDERNLTAFRGDLGTLEDAMRNDLTRVGLADSGEFHALTDSLARDLGGGAGGKVDAPESGDISRIEARVRRLIEVHDRMMSSARR
ncbi:MAG TPA: hypothetical protein VMY76_16425 [Gemmatimonadales bacterium]|nr:hypothetical protein [Gemmatimonadales bacterium]